MFNWFKKHLKPKVEKTAEEPSLSPKDKARQKYDSCYIGKIIHYYDKIQVGIIRVEKGVLTVGDMLYVQGHTTRFKQKVASIEYEHQKVEKASPGYEVGVHFSVRVREGDDIYVLPERMSS